MSEQHAGSGDTKQAPASNIKTPREWFAALTPASETREAYHLRLTVHQSAAALHGWQLHRHHEGKPIELSRQDYEQALVGAASGRGRAGIHAEALSPHKKTKA